MCDTAVQMWESGDNSSKSDYFREEFQDCCFNQADRLLATLRVLNQSRGKVTSQFSNNKIYIF